MKFNNVLFIFAVLLIIFSFVYLFFGLIKFDNLRETTGFVTSSYVNISIDPRLEINMTQSIVNWGSGTIDAGENNSTLYTNNTNSGVVERGNWSGENAKAFIIENVGSVNCSLFLLSGKNAEDLFNSASNSHQKYKWKVNDNETNSCLNATGLSGGWKGWADVNTTGSGTKICNSLSFRDGSDKIYINVLLTIPYDAQNKGNINDSITVTCNSV